jgi:hypothetical protein
MRYNYEKTRSTYLEVEEPQLRVVTILDKLAKHLNGHDSAWGRALGGTIGTGSV